MSAHSDDELLQQALELARKGIGLASPNPCVGAVIADSTGNIVGTGTYSYAGVKHAEILALEAAGPKARRGTLYINLEPHAHQGRTPPCTDALIYAGIRRVVACMPDPNPKVRERGFDQLRAAGIGVEVGRFQDEARRLNEAFARYVLQRVPLVTLKSAMTLDGKIAPSRTERSPGGDKGFSGTWITGEAARAHVHELRHQHDAILVGIGTILSDNPLLTDRSERGRRRPLLRVVLDSRLRLPLESRLVQSAASAQESGLVVFCSLPDEQKAKSLEQRGIRVEQVAIQKNGEHPDLQAVLRRLAELGNTSVMIEGGARVNGAALGADLVDKVFLYYAPAIAGWDNGLSFAACTELGKFPMRLNQVQLHHFGEDFALEGYLHDPYGE
jgi:diaminohydroxyphosphoribosylaminopyrimidine deaminase / 5-amino-6-(5-phosphoribosylamino)uracil reductase